MVGEFELTVIDAMLPLLEQHDQVLDIVEPHLSEALRAERRGWREVLAAESLQGRYLEEMLPPGGQP
jgi:hypothetical protein